MTILVTGGAGYIGSHMVHELVDAGEPVVVLDNLSTGFRFLVPGKVPFVAGSTGDRELVAQTLRRHGVTAIIHFAASIVVPDSVRDPLAYYSNNTMNTCALLDVAIKAGVQQFIFSSTAAVYGNAEQVPVREDAPTAPISPYGTSKLMSEIMLHDAGAAHGLRFVVLRYFNVAGADPKRRSASAPRSTCTAPTIRRRTARRCATTSMSAISRARIRRRWPICAAAAPARRSTAATGTALRCSRLSLIHI